MMCLFGGYVRKCIFLLVALVLLGGGLVCGVAEPVAQAKSFEQGELLHEDTFEKNLDSWSVEQVEAGSVRAIDGKLHIVDAGGCAVWFRQKLKAPLLIRYEATAVAAGGRYDNVRDLNCFFMAQEPNRPDFPVWKSRRSGKFSEYHNLRQYYVGMGGNRNTTTRFRRYPGTGRRPLHPRNDLHKKRYLLEPGQTYTIRIVVYNNTVRYYRDGELLFDVRDVNPYHEGWFGFRTVDSHLAIDNFRVHRLRWVDQSQPTERTVKLRRFPGPEKASVYDIPRLTGVTVDGKASDWEEDGMRVDMLTRFEGQKRDGAWTASNVRLGWNDKGVLVLVRTEDSRWIEAANKNRLWKLDGVELYMCDTVGSPQHYQVVLTPGMSEEHPEMRYKIYDHRARKNADLKLDAARTGKDGSCLLEVRLPWKNVGVEPAIGKTAGFQIMVNDHDDPDDLAYSKTNHAVWYPALGAHADSNKMMKIRLAKEPSPPVQTMTSFEPKRSKKSVVHVDAPTAMAGEKVTLTAGGQTLASATLQKDGDGDLCEAALRVDSSACPASQINVELKGRAVQTYPVYKRLTPAVRKLLRRAGNTADEKERVRLLTKALGEATMGPNTRADIYALMPTVRKWANGRALLAHPGKKDDNAYLCSWWDVAPDRDSFPPRVRLDSPMMPLRCLYRGRMLVWRVIEYGGLRRNPAERKKWYGEARALLKTAREAYPDNELLRMYLGEPMETPQKYSRDTRAPEWANLQREGLERLADVVHWWIDHRQISNGEFGGGWGDDCEMWRHWVPLILAFQDEKVLHGEEKLCRGMFAHPEMAPGYTTEMSDVEHTAEQTADIITPMLHMRPESALWRARALKLADFMRNLWTGRNERGFLQFKSTYFTAHAVDLTPKHACDTVYHPRAVQPTLLLWQRTGNDSLTKLFSEWMDTWVDATRRAERGKPAGITPSAIHWPDGEVGGAGEHWYAPENYPNDLYKWPSAMSQMLNTLLLTYHMTGDEKYLSPIRSMARKRMDYIQDPPENPHHHIFEPYQQPPTRQSGRLPGCT